MLTVVRLTQPSVYVCVDLFSVTVSSTLIEFTSRAVHERTAVSQWDLEYILFSSEKKTCKLRLMSASTNTPSPS